VKVLASLGEKRIARIFFPIAALLRGHESRFAPSSRLALEKNLSLAKFNALIVQDTGSAALPPANLFDDAGAPSASFHQPV